MGHNYNNNMDASSHPFLLYVKNETEELIGEVMLGQQLVSRTISNKLVIKSYSKESTILQNTSKYPIGFVKSKIDNKLCSFGRYLKNRSKAAIIEVDENNTMYILPPGDGDDGHELKFLLQSKKVVSKPVENDFLSSILGRVDATISAISTVQKTSDKASVLPSVQSRVQSLENRIRLELEDFVANEDMTEKAFEPMEKELRYIVHDVVSAFDSLISRSAGDDVERHVVVYKKGFEPEEIKIPLYEIVARKPQAKSTTISKMGGEMATTPPIVKQLEQKKRDRRTIEDIQQDIRKKNKDAKGGEVGESDEK